MELVFVFDDTMFMFMERGADKTSEDTKCIVYNKDYNEFAPELSAGCWWCRMSPWKEPTEEQIREAKAFTP